MQFRKKSINIMSGTNAEVELLRKALKLLYSSQPNSATELRIMLDEAIQQRYGAEHMLINKIGEKRLLEEEANFPGRATTPTPQQQQETEEIINLTNSPPKTISDSPDTIMDSDDGVSGTGGTAVGSTLLTGGDEDVNLKEFGDLNCCVCGEMVFTATNRLIECSKCGTLYHQECHKPAITDEEASEGQEHTWQCDSCLNKPSTSKAAGIVLMTEEPISLVSKTKSSATSSRSSSTSNSSSPFATSVQQEQSASSATSTTAVTVTATVAPTTISTSKHHHKSSRSHKEERPSSSSSKSGSSSGAINPTTSAASTSEKSTSHSSSSKKSHSSSSKSSSSKSSSKHHESSSGSGKRKQK